MCSIKYAICALTVAQIGFLASTRFDGTSYNVAEEEGSVEISVGVIESSLGTEVQVTVTRIDISAQGMHCTRMRIIHGLSYCIMYCTSANAFKEGREYIIGSP